MRRSPHALFARMQAEQGDVARMRFGRGTLVLVSHPDDIQRVLVTADRDFPRGAIPSKHWFRPPRPAERGVALGPGGDPAERVPFRRALQPVYSRSRIDALWPELLGAADAAVGAWRDGAEIDLVEEVERLTLGLVVRAVFGRPLDMPTEELAARTHACLDRRVYATSAGYRVLDKLRLRANLRAATAYDELAALLRRHIAERRTQAEDGDDVLARLLGIARTHELADEQLVLEALGQLFVGSEPVGSAASWALDRLGRDRELLASVRAEVVRSRASPDALRQTRAVLAETLRLHPPFTVIGRQARVNAELGGIPIRAGDHLLVCPYLVHRDDRWWPRPETFDPSRWRNSSHSERPRLAYLPFGAGPRQCLGEHLAWRGMETTVAAVVSRWRISALGPPPPSTALRPAGVSVRLERASADRQ